MMFIIKLKKIFKDYWFVLLGALLAFFALIFPKKLKDSAEKKNYDNRVLGQQDVLEADKIRDEKIDTAKNNAQEKFDKIEDDKQKTFDDLKHESQKELTEKLSKEFKFNNLDS